MLQSRDYVQNYKLILGHYESGFVNEISAILIIPPPPRFKPKSVHLWEIHVRNLHLTYYSVI